MDNISSSMWIMRVLSKPLKQPWSAGNTWILIGVALVSIWASIALWWLIPAFLALLLITGGIYRTSIDSEKWEEMQVHRLQQHLLWIIANRNTIARLAGARYMGSFLDTNDPLKWEVSSAPQYEEHPELEQMRRKIQFNLAVEQSQRPRAIEEAERRGEARADRTKEANSLWLFSDWAISQLREWSDIDGAYLQDTLEKYGILVPVEATEACDPEICACAEFGPFPMTCYRTAPWMERDTFFGVKQPDTHGAPVSDGADT